MIKKYRLICFWLTVGLFLVGCSNQSLLVNSSEKINESQLAIEKNSGFFISGLGQDDIIDAAEICGGGEKVGKVETMHTFMNGLVGFVTFGIYTPRNYKIYCTK